MKKIQFKAMGSRMLAVLDCPSPESEQTLQEVPAWFEEWEQCLSRFRPDSELSCLNRFAGSEVDISTTLWEVLQVSQQVEMETDGLVSPTILGNLELAGYDRSFEIVQARDSHYSYQKPTARKMYSMGFPQETGQSYFFPWDTGIDLGGIAKGWAADKAVERLGLHGPALVDAGGDIAISSPKSDGSPWPIGVTDPFHPERSLEILMLREGAVATSGTDYHRWKQGKRWNHHIIDPRTGLPAATDLLTVTVIAPDAVRAEAAAKMILILGSFEGLAWLEGEPDLEGLLVLQFGGVLYSRRMQEYIWREK